MHVLCSISCVLYISSGGHSSTNQLISEANVFVSGLALPVIVKTINGPVSFC